MKHTARLAKALGVDTVVGFTGSSIWQYVAMFPPVPEKVIEAGYQDFADRWNPILDVFDECGVRFAHEVHPSEIAYDYWTTVRTLEAIGHREAFGLNWDPSHFMWQGIDPVSFIWDFKDRIYHVDCKDTKLRPTGRNTVLGSHLPWGDPRRGWDFVSAGRGDVPWESSFRALTAIGYNGPISVEWEDAGMDRLHGAPKPSRPSRSSTSRLPNQLRRRLQPGLRDVRREQRRVRPAVRRRQPGRMARRTSDLRFGVSRRPSVLEHFDSLGLERPVEPEKHPARWKVEDGVLVGEQDAPGAATAATWSATRRLGTSNCSLRCAPIGLRIPA
ncbi:uncharacterized protein YfiH [Arthrobacter sp. Hiyo8]|nr:uncharacterized protein YfiH [Arthrobacter sp. Hiyo8]